MRTLSLSIIVSCLFFFGCGGEVTVDPAANGLTPQEGFDQTAIDTIARYTNVFPNGTQFAMALVRDSAVYYLGSIREAGQLVNIDNRQSVFEIGSISKVFTSTLLAHYAHAGRVQLDEPLQTYLPFQLKESEKNGEPITLRTLANHTAGLPRLPGNMIAAALFNRSNPYRKYSEEKLEKYLKEDLQLKSTPGEEYAYSNLGAGLLGYALSAVVGKSYEEMLQEVVFGPLRMSSSTTEREKIRSKLVKGLDKNGKKTSNWDLNALSGAGAVLSTVEDLSAFALANFAEDPALDLQRIKTFEVDKKMSLALGWHIITTQSGLTCHWHNGGTGGYSSSMAIDPPTNSAVVILSNISSGHSERGKIDRLCFKLMELLID